MFMSLGTEIILRQFCGCFEAFNQGITACVIQLNVFSPSKRGAICLLFQYNPSHGYSSTPSKAVLLPLHH